MSSLRFELDRRQFGVVRLANAHNTVKGLGKPKGVSPIGAALSQLLGVKISQKRPHIFAAKVESFVFQGETVRIQRQKDGTCTLDLSQVSDEARETVIELLRMSPEASSF